MVVLLQGAGASASVQECRQVQHAHVSHQLVGGAPIVKYFMVHMVPTDFSPRFLKYCVLVIVGMASKDIA